MWYDMSATTPYGATGLKQTRSEIWELRPLVYSRASGDWYDDDDDDNDDDGSEPPAAIIQDS